MTSSPRLTLSSYVLPELRMGNIGVTAQNLSDGRQRLAHLDGALTFLRQAALSATSMVRLNQIQLGVPFADRLITNTLVDGRVEFKVAPDAEDMLHFQPERLRVVLADGRKRRADDMLAYETGEMTEGFGRVISALMQGIGKDELLVRAAEWGVELDNEMLAVWVQQGIVETLAAGADRVPARLKRGEGDRVTWLGHAAVSFQSPDASVWVDPYLQPRFDFRDNELPKVFSSEFADEHLFTSYGPRCEQLSMHALPSPDAVLITHQDADHFSLGTLLALPLQTTIVVPKADPVNRPWEVDLRKIIHQILGADRKVVSLGHGEKVTFGSITVTAFPFIGEYPASLPHGWNCYLVETAHSTATFIADAALTDAQTDWLIGRLEGRSRPGILFARNIYSAGTVGTGMQKGYQDSFEELLPLMRLWPWYVTTLGLFEPSPMLGVSEVNIRRLVQRAGLKYFFPYALGSTPWFRFDAESSFFSAKIASMSAKALAIQAAQAASVGTSLPSIKYGEPFSLRSP